MQQTVIGIDIGGTNTVFGLVNQSGKIMAHSGIKTQAYAGQNFSVYVQALCEAIQELLADHPTCQLTGIGIGAPNGNIYKGTIEHAPNLSWKGVLPLATMMQETLGAVSVLTNDANAAALGEMLFGNAKELKDFIMITLGTGVGSGIVSGGNLIYGHDGFAGELGHAVIVPNGRQCTCGRQGCLEAYASIRGVLQTLTEVLNTNNTPSSLREMPAEERTPQLIYEAALQGDVIAIETFAQTGKMLGLKLADAANYTSPEAVILFGGIAKAGDFIIHPLKETLEANVHSLYRHKIKILPSALPDNDVAILGSAALIWQHLDSIKTT